MADESRKQSLITELDAARAHVANDFIVVRRDFDVGTRLKSNYSRRPLLWVGAAAAIGFVLSRLLPSRNKGGAVRYYQAEKPGKAAFLLTAMKLALSLAKPAIMGFLANRIQNRSRTP